MAVSYTHLMLVFLSDKVKYYVSSKETWGFGIIMNVFMGIAVYLILSDAVSYTHLDVYKRQARDIINEKSVRNAIACDMALGCSSNSVLHLLAIAHEAGVDLDLNVFNEISQVTPNLCHLAPAGGTHMHDLDNAGGVPAVMAQLASKGLIDTALPTVSSKTVGENIEGRVIRDTGAIRPIDDPYSATGGIAILWGNIAKDGCVVKRSAVAPEMLVHSGPARVLDVYKRQLWASIKLFPWIQKEERLLLRL